MSVPVVSNADARLINVRVEARVERAPAKMVPATPAAPSAPMAIPAAGRERPWPASSESAWNVIPVEIMAGAERIARRRGAPLVGMSTPRSRRLRRRPPSGDAARDAAVTAVAVGRWIADENGERCHGAENDQGQQLVRAPPSHLVDEHDRERGEADGRCRNAEARDCDRLPSACSEPAVDEQRADERHRSLPERAQQGQRDESCDPARGRARGEAAEGEPEGDRGPDDAETAAVDDATEQDHRGRRAHRCGSVDRRERRSVEMRPREDVVDEHRDEERLAGCRAEHRDEAQREWGDAIARCWSRECGWA